MNLSRGALVIIATASLAILFCRPVRAQEQLSASADAQMSSSTPRQTSDDSGWHLAVSPYLWFAGTHGTVGALGRNASVHASPGDLLSHFDFGLMGAAEARRNRFLLNGDL